MGTCSRHHRKVLKKRSERFHQTHRQQREERRRAAGNNDRRIYRTCSRKHRYSSKAAVKQAASIASKSQGIELHYYRCPYCSGWHLTKQSQTSAA